jgi:hypothetical protein
MNTLQSPQKKEKKKKKKKKDSNRNLWVVYIMVVMESILTGGVHVQFMPTMDQIRSIIDRRDVPSSRPSTDSGRTRVTT